MWRWGVVLNSQFYELVWGQVESAPGNIIVFMPWEIRRLNLLKNGNGGDSERDRTGEEIPKLVS